MKDKKPPMVLSFQFIKEKHEKERMKDAVAMVWRDIVPDLLDELEAHLTPEGIRKLSAEAGRILMYGIGQEKLKELFLNIKGLPPKDIELIRKMVAGAYAMAMYKARK